MRTNVLTLITVLLFAFHGAAQTQNQYVIDTASVPADSMHHFVSPTPSLTLPATMTYLWWFGDNYFSFAPNPTHHYRELPQSNSVCAIMTENYSNSGPPPACRRMPTAPYVVNGQSNETRILDPTEGLRLQHYRQAVPSDTFYLILTYPSNNDGRGQLVINFLNPDMDRFFHDVSNAPSEFLPNGESHVGRFTYNFVFDRDGLDRSILIPVAVDPQMTSWMYEPVPIEAKLFSGTTLIGTDDLELLVHPSHDPNMIELAQKEVADCDIDRKRFDYTVHFQNTGRGATDSIRVEVELDDRLKLRSIQTTDFSPLNQGCTGNNCYDFSIDSARNTAIWNFPSLVLMGTNQDDCFDLELTKGYISFSVKASSNCKLGDDVSALADIYFDKNPPIRTNTSLLGCPDKMRDREPCPSKGNGPRTFWPWILIGVVTLGFVVWFFLGSKKGN